MHLIRAAELGHVHLDFLITVVFLVCYQFTRILNDSLEFLFFSIVIAKKKVVQFSVGRE